MYTIVRTVKKPALTGSWDTGVWSTAKIADITHFRPESSEHHPKTQVKLLYDREGIYGFFNVEDQYVKAVNNDFQSQVSNDSCVEFFIQPSVGNGYFNFEFNCGGTLLVSYITDHTRTKDGFKEFVRIPWVDAECVKIFHSMPKVVDPEITEPVNWKLEFFIPFKLFVQYAGPFGQLMGDTWRGNFYKCASKTSHPHWAAWNPVEELNFHWPKCFGDMTFE